MHFIGKRQHFSYLTFQSSSTRQLTNGLFKIVRAPLIGRGRSTSSLANPMVEWAFLGLIFTTFADQNLVKC
jgi:hypothetical protein